MASYSVEFVKSARKEFDLLPAKMKTTTAEALKLLSQNPYSELLKIKKLKGAEHLYRIRLGDYRVVYEIRQDRLVVLVIKIGHRARCIGVRDRNSNPQGVQNILISYGKIHSY